MFTEECKRLAPWPCAVMEAFTAPSATAAVPANSLTNDLCCVSTLPCSIMMTSLFTATDRGGRRARTVSSKTAQDGHHFLLLIH